MAIVETVTDSEIEQRPNDIRSKRRSKAATVSKTKGRRSKTSQPQSEIPLAHPSTIPSTAHTTKPLISLSPSPSLSPSLSDEGEEEIELDILPNAEGLDGNAEPDEIFNTLIYAIPFTFLYLLLDILVHLQYSHRPSVELLVRHVITALPSTSTSPISLNAASLLPPGPPIHFSSHSHVHEPKTATVKPIKPITA
jgi:hypothetical protein